MKALPQRPGKAAFTLIELMVVITIIVILAGLVVGGMEYVNQRQATEKTKVQIALLSKGIEEYKLDMGAYPTTNKTDVNGTGKVRAPGSTTDTTLYNLLYLDGTVASKNTRIYLDQLDPTATKQGWVTTTDTTIRDPWGTQYRYRSGMLADGTVNLIAQNPDFDLWSCGKDGKTNTAKPSTKEPNNEDDIRNF